MGREWEGGLVVEAACTCRPEGEELLPPLLWLSAAVSLGNSLRAEHLKSISSLLFSVAEYAWPWIKCAFGTDGNNTPYYSPNYK